MDESPYQARLRRATAHAASLMRQGVAPGRANYLAAERYGLATRDVARETGRRAQEARRRIDSVTPASQLTLF